MINRRNTIKGLLASCFGLFGIKQATAENQDSEFADAIKIVRKHLQKDKELWIGYQSNIAMNLFDNRAGDHEKCNDYADALMSHVFESPAELFFPTKPKMPDSVPLNRLNDFTNWHNKRIDILQREIEQITKNK